MPTWSFPTVIVPCAPPSVTANRLKLSSALVCHASPLRPVRVGYAICDIPSNAFTGEQWGTRRSGQWKVVVRDSLTGVRKTIGWGYWTLAD